MTTPLPAPLNFSVSRRLPAKPGFALIIVLTLMALLVLLFVTLTISIQVASQVSTYQLQATQARLNAIYGVNVAMAQLQKFAGPDTRVTGTADLGRWNDTSGGATDVSTTSISAYKITALDTASGVGQSSTGNAPNILGGTRFWTGVWGNAAPSYSIYQGNSTASAGGTGAFAQPTPVLLNWLVSGNENTPLTLVANTNSGQLMIDNVTAAAAHVTPAILVKGSGNLTFNANVTSTSTLSLSGAAATPGNKNGNLTGVLLVGPNTVGNASLTISVDGNKVQVPAIDRYVVAPLVSMVVPGDNNGGTSSNMITGNYAYWVGDEGVKAKYTDADRLTTYTNTTITTAQTGTNSQASFQNSVTAGPGINLIKANSYLYRLVVPQRFAIEEMSQMGTYPANNSTLSNIQSPLQGHYVGDSGNLNDPLIGNVTMSNDPLREHFHDYTPYSYGVLSDTARGGLKYDLTTAFENFGLYQQDLQNHNILPDGKTNVSSANITSTTTRYVSPDYQAPAVSPLAGLTWNTIYNFYNAVYASNSTAVATTAAVNMGPGVTPVVVQGRLMFGFCYSTTDREVYISTSAVFVLANPYNFTINAPNGLLLHYTIASNNKYEWGLCEVARSATGNGVSPIFLTNFDERLSTPDYLPLITSSSTPFDFNGYFPILKNMVSFNSNANHPSVLTNVYFKIAGSATATASNATLLPGQVKAYAVGGANGAFKASPGDPTGSPWLTSYQKVDNGGSPKGSQYPGSYAGLTNATVNMTPNTNAAFNPRAFFLTDTGGAVPSAASATDASGELATLLPAVSCSLQMFTSNSSGSIPSNLTLIKTISGLDLSGDSIDGTPRTPPVPRQGNYKHMLGSQYYSPRIVGSYYFFLGMPTLNPKVPDSFEASSANPNPQTYLDLVNGGNANGTQGTNYSTYGQFNLRAANVAVPPWVPLNTIALLGGSSATGFPTVPPYTRVFDAGVEFDVTGYQTATQPFEFGQNMFALFFGNDTLSTSIFPAWGHSNLIATAPADPGQYNVILYSLPWRSAANAAKTNSLPVFSLGQLTGADLTADDIYSSVSYQPGSAFGNSWASPFVNFGQSIQSYTNAQQSTLTVNGAPINSTALGGNTLGPGASAGSVNAYDISYLVNAALWDHYYFSGVTQGNLTTPVSGSDTPSTSNNGMLNGRMVFGAGFAPNYTVLNIGTNSGNYAVNDLGTGTTAKPNVMPQGYALSRYLMNDGAFNVNSTSVEAWKALLASLRGLSVNVGTATNTLASNASVPPDYQNLRTNPVEAFTRAPLTLPLVGNATIYANYTYNGTDEEAPFAGDSPQSYAGFRALSDADIDHLAAFIVQQVRLRGPFLSLSQFVNRRLGLVSDPAALKGALQTAIDEMPNTAPGLSNSSASFNTMTEVGASISNTDKVNLLPVGVYSTSYINTASTNPDAVRSLGIPGWLTQADLLQSLAPVLTVRSDTFVIRAYGQVNDPLDGSVQSRAWCEAVVQRLPDYIDTTDTTTNNNSPSPALPDNPALAPWATRPQNNVFGRRFHLISLRWLSASDI